MDTGSRPSAPAEAAVISPPRCAGQVSSAARGLADGSSLMKKDNRDVCLWELRLLPVTQRVQTDVDSEDGRGAEITRGALVGSRTVLSQQQRNPLFLSFFFPNFSFCAGA